LIEFHFKKRTIFENFIEKKISAFKKYKKVFFFFVFMSASNLEDQNKLRSTTSSFAGAPRATAHENNISFFPMGSSVIYPQHAKNNNDSSAAVINSSSSNGSLSPSSSSLQVQPSEYIHRAQVLTPVTSVSVTRVPSNYNNNPLAGASVNNNNNNNNNNLAETSNNFATENNYTNEQADAAASFRLAQTYLASLTQHPFEKNGLINIPDSYFKYHRLPMFLVCSLFVVAAIALSLIFIFLEVLDFTSAGKSALDRWLPVLGPGLLLLIGFVLSFVPEKIYITFDRRHKELC
jgi:hypothetical protein